MSPLERACKPTPGVIAGSCNAAPQSSTAPRVTLIPGEPARSHTLGPGVSEETTHEVIQHFAAQPDRVQIDVSKADAQLLHGLANLSISDRRRRERLILARSGLQVLVQDVFPDLK